MKRDAADRRRLAVAVSGAGRTLGNFLERGAPGRGYEVAGVIASRRDCGGARHAEAHGLPLFVGDFQPDALTVTGAALYDWLATQRIGLVALAGFLKLFPLRPEWRGRIVNVHPALLPDFGGPGMYGARVHAAVLAAGALESGATVHFVNERYDEGAIIAQIAVPVRPGDQPADLAARVFAAECRLYPDVINAMIEGRLPLPGGRIERHRLAAG